MKWKAAELEKYIEAKEYIDTVLLPMTPIQVEGDKESKSSSIQHEIMSIFSSEIERELSGRVMLLPNYYYIKTADKNKETERLNTWIEDIEKQPFKHIFLLTFDTQWKVHEKNINGNLLWIPAIETDNLMSEEMKVFVGSQTNQVSEVMRTYWNS